MKSKSKSTADLNDVKNSLDLATRRKIIDMLQARVADGADLFYALRTAHFNVKGPSFGALHELFEKAYKFVDEAVDEMAERAVQLGGQMHSTLRILAEKSTLEEYPVDITDGLEHCEAVSDRLAAFGKNLRDNIDESEDAGDKDTSDLFVDISRAIDKFTWMVEAHVPR